MLRGISGESKSKAGGRVIPASFNRPFVVLGSEIPRPDKSGLALTKSEGLLG